MKTLKKLFLLIVLVFCICIVYGCEEPKATKIYIGEDGNWYIDDVNTGISSVGKDGVNGKSAYEIAVENGYTGTLEEWLDGIKNKDGSVTVYNKDKDEVVEGDIQVVNGKLLLFVSKTETVVTEFGTVNEIAYEGKSYKEIFEDNNYAPTNMNSMVTNFDTYSDYSGTTTLQTEDFYTKGSAMYVEGTTSQQAKSSMSYTGTFYVASKIKCTRYEKGYIGIVYGSDSSKYEDITLQEAFPDEYLTCSGIETLSDHNIFIGSAISANLDGYIDDTVIVDLSIFEDTPSKNQMDILYEKYLQIVNEKFEVIIDSKDVVTEKVYYLAEEKTSFNNLKAKETFMAYMNNKATDIGMKNSKFIDAAGFYNRTTAYDLLKLGVYASSYDDLVETWHKNYYQVTVAGNQPRVIELYTTVAGAQLEDYYFLFGGKTGTVDGQVNLLALVEGPDERLFCVVVLGCSGNRFAAAKQAMDAAVVKYNNPNADVSGYVVDAKSAAVCLVPRNNTKAYTDYPLNILYAKDIYTQRTPASITKVMTAICALDYINDINESFMINATDITGGSGNYFYAGDILTYKEALHAMMLPSSNTCAEAVATAAGHKILEYNNN